MVDLEAFSTRAELIAAVKSYYLAQNVSIVLHKNSDKRRVIFKCYHGGKYRNTLGLADNQRTRKTGSRIIDCPFMLRASFSKKENQWKIMGVDETHNHPIIENLGGYSTSRRLNYEEKAIVRKMVEAGASTSTTLSFLKANTGNQWTTRKVINNEKAAARQDYLAGKTPIQALYELISAGEYIYDYKTKENGTLCGLFFCHKSSAKLVDSFNNVFIMDCTYKTNRYGMPLLNIVGITSTYQSFNAGFAFLSAETEYEYVWALTEFAKIAQPKVIITDREMSLMNAIRIVYPTCANLLCVWHINKNILANTKDNSWNIDEEFERFMKEWNQCIRSRTIDSFYSNWNNFLIK